MNNVKDLIIEDLKRHEVIVTLPNGSEERHLYLIEITSKTSLLKDFLQTYNDVTPIHAKIAKKIFGDEESNNVYGVLFDVNLQAIFAFNREFADYNREEKIIVYRQIDDLLINNIPSTGNSHQPKPSFPQFNSGGTSGIMRYSLIEKMPEE